MIRFFFSLLMLAAAFALAFSLAFRITRIELRPDLLLQEDGERYAQWVTEQIVENWNAPFVAMCYPPRLRERLDRQELAEAFKRHVELGKLLGDVDTHGYVTAASTPNGTAVEVGLYESHIEFENGYLVVDLETVRIRDRWWVIGLGMSAPHVMNFGLLDTEEVLPTEAGRRARRHSQENADNARDVAGQVARDIAQIDGQDLQAPPGPEEESAPPAPTTAPAK